jgi:hypothetical protein
MSILESKNKADTVYVDLLGTRDMQTAIRYITQAVFERFGRTSTGISSSFRKVLGNTGLDLTFDPVSGAPKISLGFRTSIASSRSLHNLGEFLSARKKRILFVIDEFQRITKYADEEGESHFRSWMQSFPGIRFICCGSHRHMMVSMFSEKNRPLYRSSQLLMLDTIEKKDYRDFITAHFTAGSKKIEDRTIEKIFEWSRMQTYCIQLICNKLYGRFEEVGPGELAEVTEEILDQESPLFSNYTSLLTKTQWTVLKAVAKEEPLENPLSQAFISKYELGAPSSVNTALKKLQQSELIINEQGSYLIHEVLLSRWLQSL